MRDLYQHAFPGLRPAIRAYTPQFSHGLLADTRELAPQFSQRLQACKQISPLTYKLYTEAYAHP